MTYTNFAFSTVKTAPTPAETGTSVTVATDEGADFPAAPFTLTICQAGQRPRTTNAEVVLVTAIVGDILTITRAYDGTTARSVVAGDEVWNTVVARDMALAVVEGAIQLYQGVT